MNPKQLGMLGEELACEYLVKKGFNILERNYRITFGEIDIIAREKWRLFSKRDLAIHFVEVKTILGSGKGFFPEEKADYRKQRKLMRLAEIWLESNKIKEGHPYQIDIIGITMQPKTRQPTIYHFKNIAEEQ